MSDPWKSITESIVRDMVMDAYYLALRYGNSPVEAILAVVEDAVGSGFGCARILRMGWPEEIAAIMDELHEDLQHTMNQERIHTDILRQWLDGNPVDSNDMPPVSVLHPANDAL